jgi:hypothetical protein
MISTPGGRYWNAIAAIKKEGVSVRTNVARRRIRGRDIGLHHSAQAYAFTRGRRDEVTWENAYTAVDRLGRPAERVYWYHGNGAGPVVAAAFTAAGFTVHWDGTPDTAIRVELRGGLT